MRKFVDENGSAIKVVFKQIHLDTQYSTEHDLKLACLEKNIPLKSYYLTPESAQNYLISIDENGEFADKNGVTLEDGSYLVVMTGEYNSLDRSLEKVSIYASRRNDGYDSDEIVLQSLPSTLPCVVNHSNFIKGAPVVFSGYMDFCDGLIESMTNNSGHYKPQMSQILPALGYILSTAKAEVIIFEDFVNGTKYSISSDEEYENISVLTEEPSYGSDEDYENFNMVSNKIEAAETLPLGFNGYNKKSNSLVSRIHSRPMPLKDLFFNNSGVTGNSFSDLQNFISLQGH